MFRHVVMFRWSDVTTDEVKSEVQEELRKLAARVPDVRSLRFGEDCGLSEGNWDLAVVADFLDESAYRRYAVHPAHMELIERWLRPNIIERAAVQFSDADPSCD